MFYKNFAHVVLDAYMYVHYVMYVYDWFKDTHNVFLKVYGMHPCIYVCIKFACLILSLFDQMAG